MKTLLLLLLFIGAFLVMDGAHRDALKAAVREAESRGRGRPRYKLAASEDLLDLQFSTRAQQFGSMFDSTGPWAYRDDLSGASLRAGRDRGTSADGEGRASRAVEGFSGAGGGTPSLLDGLGDARHSGGMASPPASLHSRSAGVPVAVGGTTFGRSAGRSLSGPRSIGTEDRRRESQVGGLRRARAAGLNAGTSRSDRRSG